MGESFTRDKLAAGTSKGGSLLLLRGCRQEPTNPTKTQANKQRWGMRTDTASCERTQQMATEEEKRQGEGNRRERRKGGGG